MALFNITIEKVVVRQDDELLKEMLCKVNKILEGNDKQMDSWLTTLRQAIGNLETISDKVDSKK